MLKKVSPWLLLVSLCLHWSMKVFIPFFFVKLCSATMVFLISHIKMDFESYKPLGHNAVFQQGVDYAPCENKYFLSTQCLQTMWKIPELFSGWGREKQATQSYSQCTHVTHLLPKMTLFSKMSYFLYRNLSSFSISFSCP